MFNFFSYLISRPFFAISNELTAQELVEACLFKDYHNQQSILYSSENSLYLDLSNQEINNEKLNKILHYISTNKAICRNLHVLNLTNNDISQIKSNSFQSFVNLKELNLSINKIHALEMNCFFGLSNLCNLNLSFNKLNEIPINSFQWIPNLQELHISSNYISEIPSNSFQNLPNLHKLHLSNLSRFNFLQNFPIRNKNTKLNKNSFLGTKNLKFLDLSHNFINEPYKRSFLGLKKKTQISKCNYL
jgi:Leucine-rich repeat (LRR) protein